MTDPDCPYYELSVCKGDCEVCTLLRDNVGYAVRYAQEHEKELSEKIKKVAA